MESRVIFKLFSVEYSTVLLISKQMQGIFLLQENLMILPFSRFNKLNVDENKKKIIEQLFVL